MLFEQSSARARACTVAAERGLAEPDESLSVVSLDAHIAESLIDADLYCKVGLSSAILRDRCRSATFVTPTLQHLHLSTEGRPLRRKNFLEADLGQIDQRVQLRPRVRTFLRRGLRLDQPAIGGHHHVHVYLGG